MKLIIFSLMFLVALAIFSLLGLGTGDLGNMGISGDPTGVYYYDYGGHAVCTANCTAVGEAGWIYDRAGDAAWVNSTGIITQYYVLYWDIGHVSKVAYTDVGKSFASNSYVGTISLSTSLGFIALIVGLMLLASLIGFRLAASGWSDVSVNTVLKGTGFIAIWGVFSVLALNLIASGVLLNVLYFVLTLIYTLGIIMGGGSGGVD